MRGSLYVMKHDLYDLQEKEEKSEGPLWDNLITPVNQTYDNQATKPTMYSRCKKKEEIKRKLFGIECELESLGELNLEKPRQQVEELMVLQEDYTNVEEELQRFYEEEVELVKAGEDPLLTCSHCFSLFSTYSNLMTHKTSCKHQLMKEEEPYLPHYRVLEGRDKDQFLRSIERLSLHRRINICVSAKIACKGVFPLLFPSRGGVSASHLQELGLMGPEARTTLRRALLDGGELYWPEKLVLEMPEDGRQIYLPPSLLTPTASVKQGDITVERNEGWLRVSLDKETEDEETEDEDKDEDEDEDHGLTSDSSDDEEDYVSWSQEGGGPSGAPSDGGQGARRGHRSSRGRSTGPTREDQQVHSCRAL